MINYLAPEIEVIEIEIESAILTESAQDGAGSSVTLPGGIYDGGSAF